MHTYHIYAGKKAPKATNHINHLVQFLMLEKKHPKQLLTYERKNPKQLRGTSNL